MPSNYLMGIDNGGSTTKCVIYDLFGHAVACTSTHIPLSRGPQGETERDASEIWRENCRVIREALNEAGLHGSDIACVSLCGYGGGLAMLDQQQQPLAPFVVSTDSRAASLLNAFRSSQTETLVYERTMQRLCAGQPAVLLPWFKHNQPALYARCAYVITIKDYIRFCLTGCLATEATDAANTNLFSIHSGAFDPALFKILDIAECFSCFPAHLLHPCDIAGYVTEQAAQESGLLPGTPVAAGLYDVAACCLGSGILDEHTLCLIVGTWSVSGHLVPTLEECTGKSLVLPSFLENFYFLEESSPTSASNLDWFVEQFFSKMLPSDDGNIYTQCDQLVCALDPADSSLIFLPYLYGSNSVPGAKACFFNLESHHTNAHLLLSVYEGILFSLLEHIDQLFGTKRPSAARLSGGAARSVLWSQMLCDMLGIPLDVMESSETGALGGVICAAVSIGIYSGLDTACAAMCRVRHTYYPEPAKTERYHDKYQNYRKAIKALQVFYND